MLVIRCSGCKQTKPTSEFHKNKYRKTGLDAICRDCRKEYWKQVKPELARKQHLVRTYGLTWDKYLEMYEEQEGRCKLCRDQIALFAKDKWQVCHVDHNHITGNIRGLLCKRCNTGLGHFKDDIKLLEVAIKYLKQ